MSARSGSSPPGNRPPASRRRSRAPSAGAFVIGAEALTDAVSAAGLEVLEGKAGREARVVVVSGHRGFDYEELLTATLALQRGATARRHQPRPDAADAGGSLAGDRGDPRRGRDRERRRRRDRRQARAAPVRAGPGTARRPGRVAMVGDRVSSDIEGGRRAGLATILVLTGATTREDAERRGARGGPRHRRPRRADRTMSASEKRASRAASRAAGRSRSRGSSRSPSPGSSPSAPCCRSCPATSTARSTGATSRSGS